MGVFSWVLLGITLYFVVTGVLFGLKRGLIRSGVRFAAFLVALAVAWYGKSAYVDAILDVEIKGESIRNALTQGMGGGTAAITSAILPLVEIFLGVILFVAVLLVLNAVTAIICFIIGFFIPKGNRCLGMVVGLVQGFLIAFCICAPLNGVLLDVGKVMNMEIDGKPLLGNEAKASMAELGVDFDEFSESGISKFYATIGGEFYNELASVETANGNTVSLSGYVDAAVATTKIANEMNKLQEMDFSAGLTVENRDALQDTFKNLNDIKNDMSDEAQGAVNELISTVITSAGLEASEDVKDMLKDFDMTEVDFEKEGDVVLKLYELSDTESQTTASATEIVESLAESTLVLPVIESMIASEKPVELPDAATQAEVEAAIADVQKTNPEAAASLKKIFGLK